MALPPNSLGLSPASAALGLGDQLANQVAGETDEQRRKRMQQLQLQQSMGPAGSLAVTALGFGGGNAGN
jgi:hypothetical protein